MSNYLIANRSYTTGRSPLANKTSLFDLSYLSVLSFHGEKSGEFLQGQLTCDIRQVAPDHMTPGAQCNLKGRILALPDVIYWHNYHFILPEDLLLDTINSLTKAALLSRVTLEKNEQFHIYGLHIGADASSPIPQLAPYAVLIDSQCCYYAITPDCYIVLVPKTISEEFCKPFQESQLFYGSLAWHTLLLKHKRVEIYPASRGLFLPHRLDLQLGNYLSFNKGCYKGQEIIARTHYRAKLKHHLAIFEVRTSEALTVGQKIYTPEGSVEVGELIDFGPLNDNRFIIAASILQEHPQHVLLENHQTIISLSPV